MSQTADQLYVRKHNTALVLDLVRKHAPLSRATISAMSGLNRSTVSSIVSELIEEGFVIETELQGEKVGRPGILLTLNPSGGAFLGIEINVDFLSGVLVDFSTKLIAKRLKPSNPADEQHAILNNVQNLISELLREADTLGLSVMGIGIGLPGVVDTENGDLVYAPNLNWRNVPVRSHFQNIFEIPVFVDNEANCGMLGEYRFGVSQQFKDTIFLSANVGLGGGILSNGEVFRGSHGFASEIGHSVIDPSGPLCGCGRHGCWETFVGTKFIVEAVKDKLKSNASPVLEILSTNGNIQFADVLKAAEAGDELAVSTLKRVGQHLGTGIANLVNIFNPRQVVLGGVLSQAAEMLMPEMEAVVFSESLSTLRADLQLDVSELGEEACLMGAVSLVYDAVIRDPISWKSKEIF